MPYAKLPRVIVDKKVRGLCSKPYPLHPHGCPNFGKKDGCPPLAQIFDEAFDTSEVWAVWNVFDFGAHVREMQIRHPDWSQRQLECCLYWQGTARKELREEIKKCGSAHVFGACWRGHGVEVPTPEVINCPEGMGVNVTATMAQVGVVLEWPPKNYVVQVALAARRNSL